MSETTSQFTTDRSFRKCPNAIEIKCVETCAQWTIELQLRNKSYTQNHKISSNSLCTRNFKESLCKLLMATNNSEKALSFHSLKSAYGHPYLNDLEKQRPYLPIDQSNVNISSLGPEFFTFLVEVDL